MSENNGAEANNNQHLPKQNPQESVPETARQDLTPGIPAAADSNPTEPIAPLTPQVPSAPEPLNQTVPIYQTEPTPPRPAWQAPAPAVVPPAASTQATPNSPAPYGSNTPAPYGTNSPAPYGAPGQDASANSPMTQPLATPTGAYSAPQAGGPSYGQNQHQSSGGVPTAAGYPASNAYPSTLAPAVTAAPKQRKKVGMGLFSASVIAAALVGGLVAGGTGLVLASQNSNTVAGSSQAAPLVVNNATTVNEITAAAAKALPSVVTISATSGDSGGTGSGIILDTEGHILTNTHVVTLDGAAANATIQVQTSDGKVYAAKIVGTDPLSDLAIVKIDATDLVPAVLGDSTKLNVGDSVIAIGSPLGLNSTVTEGIVSTLNRTIQVASSAVPSDSADQGNSGGNDFKFSNPGDSQSSTAATGTVNLNVIQTDAAINPGNSGGALVNAKGDVIGVNVAIASASSSSSSTAQSGNIGVGFSIPIANAKRIANEIIASGKATHGQLGVSVSGTSATGDTSSTFSTGATVASVTAGSASAKAGLQKGDIITQLGDRTISDASSLTAAVREQAAGATVKITFTRDGKTMDKDVTLDAAAAS